MTNPKIIENGTAVETISWHVSTARAMISANTSTPAERWVATKFPPLPSISISEPDKKETDPIALLNKAYEALPPEDRDEMDIWDCTIKDGLEDE